MVRTSQGRAVALSFGILAHIIAAGHAQTTQATLRLRGKVLTEQADGIAGAKVRTDATLGVVGSQFVGQRHFTATTNEKGEWSLLGLLRGVWVFEATAPGYLPHVVVVPIHLMRPPNMPTVQYEMHLLVQPIATVTAGSAADDPRARLVVEASEHAVGGRTTQALALLDRLAELELSAEGDCAAGDLALLMREPRAARRFFLRAVERRPEWFRPHLGMASAALLQNDFDTAIKAYWQVRATTKSSRLQQVVSAAIAELQAIAGIQ